MEDWTDLLDDKERAEWDEIVAHFRGETVKHMDSSAFVMQLVPRSDKFDVKFALEVGAAIMLNKPILAIVMPGASVPEKLRLVADEIVEADIDTQDGQRHAAEAVRRFHARLPVAR